jgi:predicted DNA-binding transcriptional regulator AlpA
VNLEPLLRLTQIIGRKATPTKPALPAIIPVGRTSWWAGVKSGKYPQPVRLGGRMVAWRASDIAAIAGQPDADTTTTGDA